MSNSQAHITTMSQTSSTECGRRNHRISSAARLRSNSADMAPVKIQVKSAAQERRQNIVFGGDDPGRNRYRKADRNDAPQNRPGYRSLHLGAAIAAFSSA